MFCQTHFSRNFAQYVHDPDVLAFLGAEGGAEDEENTQGDVSGGARGSVARLACMMEGVSDRWRLWHGTSLLSPSLET